MITIVQGESFPIYISLTQDGKPLTSQVVQDLKVCVGNIRKKYSDGALVYETSTNTWKFTPTQKETINLQDGFLDLSVHIKYPDGSVLIRNIQKINVLKGCCKEEF